MNVNKVFVQKIAFLTVGLRRPIVRPFTHKQTSDARSLPFNSIQTIMRCGGCSQLEGTFYFCFHSLWMNLLFAQFQSRFRCNLSVRWIVHFTTALPPIRPVLWRRRRQEWLFYIAIQRHRSMGVLMLVMIMMIIKCIHSAWPQKICSWMIEVRRCGGGTPNANSQSYMCAYLWERKWTEFWSYLCVTNAEVTVHKLKKADSRVW